MTVVLVPQGVNSRIRLLGQVAIDYGFTIDLPGAGSREHV
jgi:hypothetical protein